MERNRNVEDTRERETARFRTGTQFRWSEKEWERWFIRRLREINWNYLNNLKDKANQTSEAKLENYLLKQIRRLYIQKNNLENSFKFTGKEKTQLLQKLNSFKSWDLSKPIELNTFSGGITKKLQVPLIDTENIKNNTFCVAQQVKEYKKGFTHIYDLVLLINGIPLVCIELKKAQMHNSEAWRQLKNYEKNRSRNKPFSIFNNFQLFVALNFQKVYFFEKEDLLKADVTSLEATNSNYTPLNHPYWEFDSLIKHLFLPFRIFKKIFQKEPANNQTYRVKKVLVRESIENYRTNVETTAETPFENIKKVMSPNKKSEFIEIFVGVALISFFWLINFLSGWAWWTILIGLAVIGFALFKKFL